MTGYEWFCAYLAATGSRHQGLLWQCPAHEDATPSLSVRPGDADVTLIKCFAGCTNKEVLSHLGLDRRTAQRGSDTPPDLAASQLERFPRYPNVVYKSSGSSTTHGVPISTVHHVYIPDEVRLERRRFSDGKQIRWEHLQGEFWEFGLGGRRLEDLPVYRRQEVLMALGAREPVVLCESESSVDGLIDDGGIFATTWAGGAGSPQIAALRKALAGAIVVWIPDDDAAGRTCSEQIIAGLNAFCHLATLQPGPGMDARDLLVSMGGEALRARIAGLVADGREPAAAAPPLAVAVTPLLPPRPAPTIPEGLDSRGPSRPSGEWSREDIMCINALHRLIGQPPLSLPSRPTLTQAPGTSVVAGARTSRGASAKTGGRFDSKPRTRTRSDVFRLLVDVRIDELVGRRGALSLWLRDPSLRRLVGYRESRIRKVALGLPTTPLENLPAAIVEVLEAE